MTEDELYEFASTEFAYNGISVRSDSGSFCGIASTVHLAACAAVFHAMCEEIRRMGDGMLSGDVTALFPNCNVEAVVTASRAAEGVLDEASYTELAVLAMAGNAAVSILNLRQCLGEVAGYDGD